MIKKDESKMMKNVGRGHNKQPNGFTLVELVIVIAVIAVLAAVLIPTFSSLIRKANISSDTVLAKNLNTAVSLYKAENGNKDMTFEDALKAAKERGYVLGNLNAKAKDCYFVWENQSDQFLLIEKIKEEPKYNVLFNIADGFYQYDETKGENNKKWYFSASDLEVINNLKQVFRLASFVKVAADYGSLRDFFNKATNDTIYLGDDVVFEDGEYIPTKEGRKIVLDLNGNTLGTVSNNQTKRPIWIGDGSLVVKNGEISGSGNQDGCEVNTTVRGNVNGVWLDVYVLYEDITLNNSSCFTAIKITVGDKDGAGDIASEEILSKRKFEIKDSTIISGEYAIENGSCELLIDNTNISSNIILGASFGSKTVINSGTFNCLTNSIAELNNVTADETKKTKLIINGGDFYFKDDLVNDDKFIFDFGGTSTNNSDNVEVIISGGNFNGTNYEKFFEEYTIPGDLKDSLSGFISENDNGGNKYDISVTKAYDGDKVVFTIKRDTKESWTKSS